MTQNRWVGWGVGAMDEAFGVLRPGRAVAVWDLTGYAGLGLVEAAVHAATAHRGRHVALLSSMDLAQRHPQDAVPPEKLVRQLP